MSLIVFLAISEGRKFESAENSPCTILWKSDCMCATKSVSFCLLKMSMRSGSFLLIDSIKWESAVYLV